MQKISATVRSAFQQDLVAWYERHRRDLPWRRTRDPYAVAISEFMLQQTQVVTVIPYYEKWLRLFPDWKALARADGEKVLKAWEGLGYYSRARNLHKLAQVVVQRGGDLPREVEELQELPGIGPYTAGAIASIAYGQNVALLDGNVIRILTRVFAIGDEVGTMGAQRTLWQMSAELLPQGDCGIFNQALMELGALICSPRQPQCLLCPLQKVCRGRKMGPEQFPVKVVKVVEEQAEIVALLEKKGKWWVEPGPVKGRLAEMWRFPSFDPQTMQRSVVAVKFTYGITKYRVKLTVVHAKWKQREVGAGQWMNQAEMESRVFSAAHRKIRRIVLGQKGDTSA
jgi:A/G-specific adenine glycosylase